MFRSFFFIVFASVAQFSSAADVDYKAVQTDLNRMGYEVGTPDGIPGKNTKKGIAAFFKDAGYISPKELSVKDAEFINSVANYTDKPIDLIKDVITKRVSAEEISDEKLCEINSHIDLLEVFQEIKKRKVKCTPNIAILSSYDGKLISDPSEMLYEFKDRYDIKIPNFDLKRATTFNKFDDVKKIYHDLNPLFDAMLSQDEDRINYCAEWMPSRDFFALDPSKNLDGSGSWKPGSLVGGSVLCENSISHLYLGAFSKNEQLADKRIQQFKNVIDTLVSNNGANNFPYRPYNSQTNPKAGFAYNNFTYLRLVSKLSAGVELMQDRMDWSSTQRQQYASWLKHKALQALPVEGRSVKTERLGSLTCNLSPTPENMNNACQNSAPYTAHLLLRAAIANEDEELAELSYLVFKQYTSGLRKDGSQAADSIRQCYAAGYTIWAAMFLQDYVYLASKAGVDLWDDRFSDLHGSPKDNVEYAIKVQENFNFVNEYAQDLGFPDCQIINGELQQQNTRVVSNANFAFYYKIFMPELFDGIYLEDRNLFSYSDGSGVNYEVDILLNEPDIIEYFRQNEENILGDRVKAKQKSSLERREKQLQAQGYNVLRLNWFTELSSEGFVPQFEAYDVIKYNIESKTLEVSHFDVSADSVKGREMLNYRLSKLGEGSIIIGGEVDVLNGDKVKVRIKANLSPGTTAIDFGRNDRLVLSWE